MMLWAMDNQAPANIMLISGDRDYSYALHQLGMRRYNILLARPDKASEPLIAAARKFWLWTSIANVDLPNRSIDAGRVHRPNSCSEVLCHVVPKQAQPSKRIDSGFPRGTKRNRSSCELCNVVCSNHDLTAHLSGKRLIYLHLKWSVIILQLICAPIQGLSLLLLRRSSWCERDPTTESKEKDYMFCVVRFLNLYRSC